MDLSFTQEEEHYRQRVRQFMQENLPPGWGKPGYKQPGGEDATDFQREIEILFSQRTAVSAASARARIGRSLGKSGDPSDAAIPSTAPSRRAPSPACPDAAATAAKNAGEEEVRLP